MDMSKVPLFQTLLDHECSSQDGYQVLYAMLYVCHPKLVEKSKLEAPTVEANGNLSTFISKYSNYLECEKISKRQYSDMEKLTYIINTLDTDGRFEKALNIIRIQKNTYEEMTKTQSTKTFPHLLTLDAVPYTIMNASSEREKQELFGTNNNVTTPTLRAITTIKDVHHNPQIMHQDKGYIMSVSAVVLQATTYALLVVTLQLR